MFPHSIYQAFLKDIKTNPATERLFLGIAFPIGVLCLFAIALPPDISQGSSTILAALVNALKAFAFPIVIVQDLLTALPLDGAGSRHPGALALTALIILLASILFYSSLFGWFAVRLYKLLRR
ncbi:MAG: hypothetical protein WCV84_05695 [Patescibacteria group bacterium]